MTAWGRGGLLNHPVILGLDPRISRHQALRMFVYIVTNRPGGTLYVGVVNDLVRRAYEHRTHAVPGFTDRYNLERLVWFEPHDAAAFAIRREKALERWNRAWKVELIERANPAWRDLWGDIVPGAFPHRYPRA